MRTQLVHSTTTKRKVVCSLNALNKERGDQKGRETQHRVKSADAPESMQGSGLNLNNERGFV